MREGIKQVADGVLSNSSSSGRWTKDTSIEEVAGAVLEVIDVVLIEGAEPSPPQVGLAYSLKDWAKSVLTLGGVNL